MRIISLVFLLATLHSVHAALFYSKAVRQLTGSNNIRGAIRGSKKAVLVAAYAPWCGYCKQLGPEFDKAAENLKDLVHLVAVDCDAQENREYCQELGVQGFPTLKVYSSGGAAPPETYQGERKAKAMAEYMTSKMPSFVNIVRNTDQLKEIASNAASQPQVLLFTSSKKVTPLYKALSTELQSLKFHIGRDTTIGEDHLKSYGVGKLPELIVLTGENRIKYSGALKFTEIKTFLSGYVNSKKGTEKEAKGKKVKDEL